MLSWIGWVATAVFASSYLCKQQATLRRVQAAAAVLWVVYGVLIHALSGGGGQRHRGERSASSRRSGARSAAVPTALTPPGEARFSSNLRPHQDGVTLAVIGERNAFPR